MIESPSPSRDRGARPFQLLLRATTVAGAVLAIGCTRLAADEPLVELEVAVLVLSLLCAAMPDSHVGLLVVIAIGATWLAVVDDPTTPWAVGAAVGVALFHTSLAAASVAPLAARWGRAMRHRWGRRLLVQVAVAVPVWVQVALVGRIDIPASSIVMTGALLVLAIAGLWAAQGGLRADRSARSER